MTALSPGVSRLYAVGILVILLGALLIYAVLPLWRYYSGLLGDLDFRQQQITRYQTLLANEVLIDEELERIEQGGSESELFLSGSKSAIASANLREFITESVRDSGGELISSQEYDTEAIDSAIAIGLQVQVKGEIENLVQLLDQLEGSRPVTFIDELNITSSNTRVVTNRPARHDRSPGVDLSLEAQMKVVGYFLGSEDTADADTE